MKNRFSIFMFILCAASASQLLWAMELKAADATKCAVLVEESASDDTLFAAHDLKNHLEKATGTEVVLCHCNAALNDVVRIEVGTAAAKAHALKAAKSLASGESAAVCDGRSIHIWGEGRMGTSNGVYVFLEDRMGMAEGLPATVCEG